MDYTKFVTKREKSLKIALMLAIMLMVIGFLIFSNDDNTSVETGIVDNSKPAFDTYKWGFFGLAAILMYIVFGRNKNSITAKTDEEIIKFVADKVYIKRGIPLNTSLDNVTVQKGGVDETYVEFWDKKLTFMYLEGTGIVERYPGKLIQNIKKGKHSDVIEMEMAKGKVATKKLADLHNTRLEAYDLTGEEA